jgi:hypothetical protein
MSAQQGTGADRSLVELGTKVKMRNLGFVGIGIRQHVVGLSSSDRKGEHRENVLQTQVDLLQHRRNRVLKDGLVSLAV